MKGKILSLLLFIYCFCPILHAQDILTKRNGDEMQVKVTEITLDDVKYKRYTNLTGPTFVIAQSDVFMIKYENGDKDLFEKDQLTGDISLRHIPNRNSVQSPVPVQHAPAVIPSTANRAQEKPVTPPGDPEPTDSKEQYKLGKAYEKGNGRPQDKQKAADWYLKAALQGHVEAQYDLGILYTTNKGILITTQENYTMRNGQFVNAEGYPLEQGSALYWWRKAAAQGHAGAKAKINELEAKNKPPVITPTANTPPPTSNGLKEVKGDITTSVVEARNKKYTISIGSIDKNEKGETEIELLIPEFKDGIRLNFNGTTFTPVQADMEVEGKTISAHYLTFSSGENGSITFTYKSSLLPDRIILLKNEDGKFETPCMIFDGKTKKLLYDAGATNEEPPKVSFDARKGEHDLIDLIENKIVEVEIKGSDITNVNIRLRRLVSYPVKIKVPVGSFFVSANTSKQNMVGTAERKITLNTDSWTNLSIPAACANRPRGIPGSNDSFSVIRSPHQAELSQLMPALVKAGANTLTKQAAVWIITDNANYADLGILQVNGYARAIGVTETARAMQICTNAGIDIKSKRIWKDKDYLIENLSDGALRNWLKEQ